MRLSFLYLRSRTVFPAALGLLLIAGLGWAGGHWLGNQRDWLTMVSVVLPLAAAVVVSTTLSAPFGELERSLSRPLADLRFGHVAGLLIIATVGVAGASLSWHGEDLAWVFARNVAGLAGLGLLCARVLGGRLSWTAPTIYGLLAVMIATHDRTPTWAWVMLPTSRDAASAIAVTLLFAGVALATMHGSRIVDDA